MESFILHLPYIGVATILLLSGFGLPLPEDVPLILGGYLCGTGRAELGIMMPLGLVCVIGADCMVFGMGRRYGGDFTRLKLFRRFMSQERLAKAALSLHEHSGKTLFIARFLPGLRTPIFFTAGTFRIPFWKMLVFDGGAALISVPVLILLAYHFADHLAQIKSWTRQGQITVGIIALLAAGGYVMFKIRRAKSKHAPTPADPALGNAPADQGISPSITPPHQDQHPS